MSCRISSKKLQNPSEEESALLNQMLETHKSLHYEQVLRAFEKLLKTIKQLTG